MKEYRVIDTHTAGEPTRIITSFRKIRGTSMSQVKKEMQTNYDWFRRFMLQEPRGHSDMFGAVLFPPRRKECDLGVIFMDNEGYLDMCGHGTIGVITSVLQTGIIKPKKILKLDTPAGVVKARVRYHRSRVQSVSFENVPSFKYGTAQITIANQSFPVDIAFGGNFFAHVDAKKLGIAIEPRNKAIFVDMGIKILDAVNRMVKIVHPEQPQIDRVALVEFSGPAKTEGAHARNVVVFGRGQIDRSPCGTGTCAKMALLHSEGRLKVGDLFVHEGILGTMFTGRLLGETQVGDYDAVVPEITGSAHITGFNRLIFDTQDPFVDGFLL